MISGALKETLDVSKIFLAYLAAGGDAARTALIAQCKVDEVLFLAKTEFWDAKLEQQGVIRGQTAGEAKERTREINRAANYVQSLRLRALIDKTIQWIYENEENIAKFNQETNKQGKKVFSTKPLLDLTKAAEACQTMLYRALGDTVSKEEGGSGGGANLRDLHKLVIDLQQNLPPGTPIDSIRLAEKVPADPAQSVVGYLDEEPTS